MGSTPVGMADRPPHRPRFPCITARTTAGCTSHLMCTSHGDKSLGCGALKGWRGWRLRLQGGHNGLMLNYIMKWTQTCWIGMGKRPILVVNNDLDDPTFCKVSHKPKQNRWKNKYKNNLRVYVRVEPRRLFQIATRNVNGTTGHSGTGNLSKRLGWAGIGKRCKRYLESVMGLVGICTVLLW